MSFFFFVVFLFLVSLLLPLVVVKQKPLLTFGPDQVLVVLVRELGKGLVGLGRVVAGRGACGGGGGLLRRRERELFWFEVECFSIFFPSFSFSAEATTI